MEKITYKVEAKSNTTTGMEVVFKGYRSKDDAMDCALTLMMAFPQVDVICEQTGEVMYSQYVACDWYQAQVEMGKAIYHAECDRYI